MKTTNRYQLDGGVTEFFFQLEHNTFLAANTLIMVYMTNSDSFSAARETRRGRKEGRKICADSRNNLPEEEETMGLIFRPDCFSFQFLPASRGSQRETIKNWREIFVVRASSSVFLIPFEKLLCLLSSFFFPKLICSRSARRRGRGGK